MVEEGLKEIYLPYILLQLTSEHTPSLKWCLYHSAGRVLTSDWSVSSFIMVVYENLLAALWTENSN